MRKEKLPHCLLVHISLLRARVVFQKDPDLFLVFTAGGCGSMGVSEDSERLCSSAAVPSPLKDGGVLYLH